MTASSPTSPASLARCVPALGWLRSYDRQWLRDDVVAGITLAAHFLPAGLGDASLANLPPQAGLYACLFGGLVFWRFCSSRHTAITVTSAISLLIGFSLRELAQGDTTRFGALAAGTAVLVAGIAFLAWLVKAGAIVNFLSESVRTGFKCGVALFLASTQLPKLFGVHGAHGDFWENSRAFFSRLNETNPWPITVGGIALAALILGRLLLKHKPVALFVVVGGILASSLLQLDQRNVKLLGEVPQGLPDIGLQGIHWADLPSAFYFSAVTYTTTGYGDRVLPEEWRLVGGVEALTGILMCGWSTGFFFAVVSRMLEQASKQAPPTAAFTPTAA